MRYGRLVIRHVLGLRRRHDPVYVDLADSGCLPEYLVAMHRILSFRLFRLAVLEFRNSAWISRFLLIPMMPCLTAYNVSSTLRPPTTQTATSPNLACDFNTRFRRSFGGSSSWTIHALIAQSVILHAINAVARNCDAIRTHDILASDASSATCPVHSISINQTSHLHRLCFRVLFLFQSQSQARHVLLLLHQFHLFSVTLLYPCSELQLISRSSLNPRQGDLDRLYKLLINSRVGQLR